MQIMFTISNGIGIFSAHTLTVLLKCAVERFNRMKTRNKMASRANKENRKKSTATPIAGNTHARHVHHSLITANAHDDPH